MAELSKRQIAEGEVKSWLEFQHIPVRKQEFFSANVQNLIDAVEDGFVIINPDKSITQKLMFPFGEDLKVTELKFKSRLMVAEIKQAQEPEPGEEAKENSSTFDVGFAYIKALTGQLKSITGRMNNKDYKISDNICLFFML